MAVTIHRRWFLCCLTGLFATAGRALAACLQPILPNRNEAHAVAEIKRNGETAFVAAPNQESVALRWRDEAFQPGSSGFYYVRITQADGEEAISSPVWTDA